MKLRLRSFESKQTLKIEVPNPCTLSQLRQILAQAISDSPPPGSIRLSLNRKDDLQSDGGDSLSSLGIAAGDLIYFSIEQPAPAMGSNSQNTLPQVTASTCLSTQSVPFDAQSPSCVISGVDSQKGESSDRVSQMEDTMEVDDEDNNENSYETGKSFSVPGFLRKVFMEELGNDAGKYHKLIVIAVHAVMLETGFVGFDKNANIVFDGFHFRNRWPSSLFRVSLPYSLQQIPTRKEGEAVKSVVLKFQSVGKFINVYGTLENGSGNKGTYRLQLDEEKLIPFLNVVWANISGEDGYLSGTSPEKEVFKFWRAVKDNLALPLLIDLCEELGFELPPCFMRLPTDLKLRILESLPGVEIAKMSCVCSELRYLGSNDDLWKMKFAEEFGNKINEARGSWKSAFANRHKNRKLSRGKLLPFWPAPFWGDTRRRHSNPFMVPRVPRIIGDDPRYIVGDPRYIGDDNDILPPFGGNFQTRMRMRTLSPKCYLGVRGGGRFV